MTNRTARAIVANVQLRTRGRMPSTGKATAGGRKWRTYLAASARRR